MKKWKGIACLFVMALVLLTACGNKKSTNKVVSKDRYDDNKTYMQMSHWAESEDGLYGVEWGEEYSPIFFVDKNSGKKVVLCQKLNCKHDSPECPAIEEGTVGCLAYSNETLYFHVMNHEESQLELYSMKYDGTEKKRLHVFENARIYPNQAGLYKGKIVLSVQTQKELEDGTGATTAEPSIILYDLKTKQETVLIDGAQNEGKYTIPCGGSKNGIYLLEISWNEEANDYCKYFKYNLETGKFEDVYQTTRNNIQFVENDQILLKVPKKNKIERYHIDTKKKEVVFEWKERVDVVWAREDHVELQKKVKKDGKEITYANWYDLEEKKYLFDEYQELGKVKVRDKTNYGYWIYKNGEHFFYHIENNRWQKVEEVK